MTELEPAFVKMLEIARKCNAFESDRVKSFKSWPFDNKKKCNVTKVIYFNYNLPIFFVYLYFFFVSYKLSV